MEKISCEDFALKAEQLFELDPLYRIILIETLGRMEKEHAPVFSNHFKENFQELKSARSLTYEELSQLLMKEYGLNVDVNTLKSYGRKDRKTLSSSYSKEIAKIFGVLEEELIYGKDYMLILSKANCDIKNMFLNLSQENKEAVYYLVSALYRKKIAPEFFENECYEN